MKKTWRKTLSILTAGFLTLNSAAFVGAATSPGPISPDWNLDQAIQEMRDTWTGGTVKKEEMTGQVREFKMHIDEIEHEIMPGVKVKAWGFGLEGQPATVPGPEIRVKKGDLVRIQLKNNTDQPHSIHSHGITSLDELNDGVPHVTGAYVMPGQTFTYEYVVKEAGTHWYHCHVQTSLHQDMGMYGPLIVEDTEKKTWDKEFVAMVDEWDTHRDPGQPEKKPTYNYFVVNGKSGSVGADWEVKDGEIARIRLINSGFENHSLHLHGTHFVVTHKDGYQLPAPYRADTLDMAPGETYDLLVKGRDGVWPWHDHNSLAATDDGKYPGGMIMHIRGSKNDPFNPSYNPPRIPLEGAIHGEAGHAMEHGQMAEPTAVQAPAQAQTAKPVLVEMKPPVLTKNAVKPDTTISQAVAFNPVAPKQAVKGEVVEVNLEAKRVKMEVAPGDVREVWTFNGSVPAPTLRVHQGDTVRINLINKDSEMEHGLDFHAGQMDMGTYHQPIKPGDKITFEYKASYPGVWFYHCSAGPVISHIANGMFGAVIVDPPGYKPTGKEYVLVQNEWYKAGADLQELLEGKPTSVAFNGIAQQYMNKPLKAAAGEKVRFYVVNAGPNDFSSFHVIGEIFDHVYLDGNPQNVRKGVQSVIVPPGGALITELAAEDGVYAILTHQMNDAMKGALGVLQVGKGGFSDVPKSYWAHDVIQQLVAQGVLKGVNESQFAPQKSVSRAEFAVMLGRALNLEQAKTQPFQDVPKDSWYAQGVASAYKAGIIKGHSIKKFVPHQAITREEMAVMMSRAYEKKTGHQLEHSSTVTFKDHQQISPWALDSVSSLAKQGLMKGQSNNHFNSKGLATRAESAQVIYNLIHH